MTRIVTIVLLALFAPFALAQSAPQAKPATAQHAAAKAAAPAAAKSGARLPITGASVLSQLDKGAPLRVGVAVNLPWVVHDKSGQLVGYSVDIARKIAADMGWKLELVPNSWPNLINGLRAGQYDVIISGLSVTPQRARSVRFTRPVDDHGITAVVNRHNVKVTDIAALQQAGAVKVAVLAGTRTAAIAKRMLPNAQITEVDDLTQAIADLRAGKYDALVAESPTPRMLEKIYPKDLRKLDDEFGRTAHAFAVRPGDADLRDVLDAWIIEAQMSGWLKQRGEYWFKGTDWTSQL